MTIDDLHIAIAWLEFNEGDNGESDSCKRVANWLQAEIVRREKAAMVREVSKAKAIPPRVVRELMSKMDKK